MNAAAWARAKSLLADAADLPASDRERFVVERCPDPEVRREVLELLASPAPLSDIIAAAAPAPISRLEPPGQPAQESRDFPFGATVSHYRMVGKLGVGGMGVVYKAEDSRLQRVVALKFLSDELDRDPDAVTRFRREAQAASALNHPNICTIHDVGEKDGRPFIVMEFLDGTTLRYRLAERPLQLDILISLAIEIADALDSAHSAGIIHRDVKSSNIFVTRLGHAKILDFGLAKVGPVFEESASAADASRPTLRIDDHQLTRPGSTPGTVSYMSPEQVRAQQLDARTDVFAFGVVLYEMATSKLPFPGESPAAIFDAILNRAPVPPLHLNPALPGAFVQIVDKCLEKDRHLRYQRASEIRADLQRLQRHTDSAPVTTHGVPGATTSIASRRKVRIRAGAAAVLALVAAGSVYRRPPPHLSDKDTIVLADFTNTTGDPVFDGTLRQGLAVQLAQSPFLSLVSEERIQKALRLMGQAGDARLTPQVAKEVCERASSAAVLDGSITSLGSQYVLGLRARNCHTGEVLDEEQVQAAQKEDVLNALSQMASRFRTRVGESLTTIEAHGTPLEEATTPSLDALKAYSAALKVLASTGDAAALPLFKRAIEIDPAFAMAYANLARSYGDLGESDLTAETTSKAYQLRSRTNDAEKFFITASYDLDVTGNLERAQQTCEAWARTYPREMNPHGFMGGIIYPVFGKYEKAVEESKKAIAFDPDFAIGYSILAWNYTSLNRLREAEIALQGAAGRKLDIPDFLIQRYDLAFLNRDKAGMEREAAFGRGQSGTEDWMAGHEAFALAYSGRLKEATRMSRRASDLAQRSARRERAALHETGPALFEAWFGNAAEARRTATAALELSSDREVEYGAAFALALSGEASDSSRSQILANDLEQRFGEDTSVKYSYMPALRARLALNHGDPSKAIELLQIAIPYELGTPHSSFFGFFGTLYPVYVRGEAYLAAHQGVEAATEFQKILDHPGGVVSDPIGALAHWQLGRAFVLSGDNAKAEAAYQGFLTLWKDADADIPILRQAKAEYARLSLELVTYQF